MGFFSKTLQAAMPKMIGNPITTAVAMVSVALSVVKGKKAKKATKGKKKTTVRKSKIVSKKRKKQMEIMERVCQSAYGTYIRGVTTVAARYIGHPAVAIPASEMIKTMMEKNAPTVNYLVQLKAKPKKENAIKEQKEDNILEYAKKGTEYVEGYYDSYWRAFNGEQVIDEKYTLENLFSGNLTIDDIPDIPELINMVGATKGALARGVGNSLKGTYDTVKTLVTEPGKVWDAVSSGASDFIEHPWESTKEFVGETCDGIVDAVWRSTPQDMAEDVGEIVGDVAVDALTAGSGAVIVTGLKTGAKKLTISAGKTVTKTVAKTAGKTAIKETGKKTIKELIPDVKTVKKWMPKDLPINEGWLKNVVTAGGDINALKKNNYQAIFPNDKKPIKDVLQKTSKNTAKEKAADKTEDAIQKVARENSRKTGDGVHTSSAVNETKVVEVKKVEGNKLEENGMQTKAGKEIGKEITQGVAEQAEKGVADDVTKAISLENKAYVPYTDERRKYIIPPKDGYEAYLERQYIEIRKKGIEDVSIVAKSS